MGKIIQTSQLSVLALVALVSPSHADEFDYKIYPGGGCLATEGSPNVVRSFLGALNQSQTDVERVFCPVVRDSFTAPLFDVEVAVALRPSLLNDQSTSCSIVATDATAENFRFASVLTTQRTPHTLYFVLPAADNFAGGTYSVLCSLGPGTTLASYYVGEGIDTDDRN